MILIFYVCGCIVGSYSVLVKSSICYSSILIIMLELEVLICCNSFFFCYKSLELIMLGLEVLICCNSFLYKSLELKAFMASTF